MNLLLELSREAWRTGNVGEAEALCRQILKAEPKNAAGLTLLGTILSNTRRVPEGIRTLQTAIQIDKTSAAPCIALSQAYGEIGDLDGAIRTAQIGVDLEADNADALETLGRFLSAAQRLTEALDALRLACKLKPDAGAIHQALALVCRRTNLPEEAETHFRMAINLEPGAVVNRLALGGQLLSERRVSEAVEILSTGLEYSPSDPELHMLLGKALFAQADEGLDFARESGEQHLRKSIALRPLWGQPYATLGARFQALGRFEEAKQLLEKAIELEPNRASPYLVLARNGRHSFSPRQMEKMSVLIQGRAVQGKDLAYLHYALAKSYEDLDNAAQAMSHYDAANREMFSIYRPLRPFNREAYAERFELAKRLFTADVLSSTPKFEKCAPAPIFVIGMMRSGTSLVEQILASHPEVGGCGELSFWRDRARESYRKSKRLPALQELESLRKDYEHLISSSVAKGKLFATDKLPQNYESLGLIQLAFRDAPVVYVKRNPIDTCLSIYTTPYDHPPVFGFDKGDIAFAYQQQLLLMEHWISVMPRDRIHVVSYEELVGNKERVVRGVIEYCGLRWSDACLTPEKTERVINTPNRWEVRQPVYISSVKRSEQFEPWIPEFNALDT